jgi:hypothetical protein
MESLAFSRTKIEIRFSASIFLATTRTQAKLNGLDTQARIQVPKVKSAGFDRGAAIKQKTKAIATEVEQARLYRLKAVARDSHVFPSESTFTHQALRCCDEYSSQFLRANPDAVGILTDAQFTEGFHTYLGLPSPCTANFVGQHIAGIIVKIAPKPICEYGIAITNAQVPGYGWRQCHDKLERTIAGMS